MALKSPNAVDVAIGGRIRWARLYCKMSQQLLGDELGVSFQQIQKYEQGLNRVSAGRLHQIARVLNVRVTFFYEGLGAVGEPDGFMESDDETLKSVWGDKNQNDQNADATSLIDDFLSLDESIELIRLFIDIKDPNVRRQIVEMVRTLGARKEAVGDR